MDVFSKASKGIPVLQGGEDVKFVDQYPEEIRDVVFDDLKGGVVFLVFH